MVADPLARARRLLEAWQALRAAYAEVVEIAEMLQYFPVGKLPPDAEGIISFLTRGSSALLEAARAGKNPEGVLEEAASILAQILPDLRSDALQVHAAFVNGTLAGLCALAPDGAGFNAFWQAFILPEGMFTFKMLAPAPAMDLAPLTEKLLPEGEFRRFSLTASGWTGLLSRRGEWLRAEARLRPHAERPRWRPEVVLARLGLQGLDAARPLW
jgi:hypothetical protein